MAQCLGPWTQSGMEEGQLAPVLPAACCCVTLITFLTLSEPLLPQPSREEFGPNLGALSVQFRDFIFHLEISAGTQILSS